MRNVTHQDIMDAFRACGVDLPSLLNGLGPTAKAEAFAKAKELVTADYKKLCRACHPDLHQDAHELATQRFQYLQEAFEIVGHSDMQAPARETRREPSMRPREPYNPIRWAQDNRIVIEEMRRRMEELMKQVSRQTYDFHSVDFGFDPPPKPDPGQPKKKKWGGYGTGNMR